MTADPTSSSNADLLQRLARVEAMQAIGQLPIRYAVAVDSRDLDTWVSLFIDDVNCGRHGIGREALRSFIDPAVRGFYRSIHQICGHRIDLIDEDNATGMVYCRAEHEDDGRWIVMAICYFDTYERRDGAWFFARRKERHWYATDAEERPRGPEFLGWPGHDEKPALPHAFATWADFWAGTDKAVMAKLTVAP